MTTLIVDHSNRTMYADKQTTSTKLKDTRGFFGWLFLKPAYESTTVTNEPTTKVFKFTPEYSKCEILFAGAGDTNYIKQCEKSVRAGKGLPTPTEDISIDCTIINLIPSGEHCVLYEYRLVPKTRVFGLSTGLKWKRTQINKQDGYSTFGSGTHFAAGALNTGVPIDKVFESVSICDPYTSSCYNEENLNESL